MRQIKFRAWDTELKCFVESIVYDLRLDGKVFFRFDGRSVDQTFKLILQEYFGLKDKRGTEVCEGDILKLTYPGINAPLVFIERYAGCFWGAEITEQKRRFPIIVMHEFSEREIIGNIHENPELLS